MRVNRKLIILIGFICIAILGRNYLKEIWLLFAELDVAKVVDYIRSFGIIAPIISFLLMIIQSIAAPLPAFLITFANANIFGWIKGAILSWSSALTGAIICFYISKFFGRHVVEKLTSKLALEGMDNFFNKYGKYAVLIARLIPFISFDLVSYAAGLTSMNIGSFIIATGIGQLPATIVYSYVGEMLTGGLKQMIYGLLIIMSLTAIVWLTRKMILDKKEKINELS